MFIVVKLFQLACLYVLQISKLFHLFNVVSIVANRRERPTCFGMIEEKSTNEVYVCILQEFELALCCFRRVLVSFGTRRLQFQLKGLFECEAKPIQCNPLNATSDNTHIPLCMPSCLCCTNIIVTVNVL